ncbi:hypothetical protein GCM10020254_56650 [Streptomyces goshikiensis]
MAGRINDDDVKAVRDAVPIDAVVSDYLQLRNAGGGNLKGLCPFHDEKSPSFQVSPGKGLYHCFGCQAGGDTLDFIMKIDHLSFSEAVERLAGQAGITLRYEEGGYTAGTSGRGERIRLVEAHKAAAQFYVDQLGGAEAEIGRKFLAERGFDQAAAEHFSVGYSPAGWDHLTRFLRGKGFTDKELITSGLAQDSRSGKPIDRFRGRLMWPIRDISGEVVGFGARKLRDDDNGPKYLNTPETAIYKKSQVLYGIDLAKKEIAKTSRAVVVEGYTDVMACHMAGVTTAIATCGTAFGGDHIKILRRLLMDNATAEVIFTFDGDAAGQKAALRAFEDDQKFAAETSITIAPPAAWTPATFASRRATRRCPGSWRPVPRCSSSRCGTSWPGTTWRTRRAGRPRSTRPRPSSPTSRTSRSSTSRRSSWRACSASATSSSWSSGWRSWPAGPASGAASSRRRPAAVPPPVTRAQPRRPPPPRAVPR